MKSSLFCVLMLSLAPLLAPPLTGRAFAGSIEGPEAKIEKGDVGIVSEDYSVYVWNPEPIRNKDQIFKYGDSCTIEMGNSVSVIGLDGGWVLIRYSVASAPNLHRCPSGIVSYIPKDLFLEMKSAQEEKDKVRQLLKEEKK